MIRDDIYRRLLGLAAGAGLGLGYGLVSESINRLLLQDIPLYSALGLSGGLLLWTGVGLLLGGLCAWTHESLPGLALSTLFGGLLVWGVTFSQGEQDALTTLTKIFSALYLFLPLTALILPFTGLLRWTINRLVEMHQDRRGGRLRYLLISLPLIFGALLGSFTAYPSYGREMVRSMHAMLQQAARATQVEQLPTPLQHFRVEGFIPSNQTPYTLEWLEVDVNRYALALPGAQGGMQTSGVLARYASGYRLLCIYVEAEAVPACLGSPQGYLP